MPFRRSTVAAPRFDNIEDHGKGAFGDVYQATDRRLRRQVAVKEISVSLPADERDEAKRRFEREAQIVARFSSPHIVTVYGMDDDVHQGESYLYLEFVPFGTLQDMLKQQTKLSVGDAVIIARDVARAIEVHWAEGIVHRDIKPANILVLRDNQGAIRGAKLADYGIALDLKATARTQIGGDRPGTPQYMSPEQAASSSLLTAASDIYNVGLILWEMLTGVPRFREPYAAITEEALDAPAPLVRIIQHSLEHDITQRYQDPSVLVRDLEEVLSILRPGQAPETDGAQRDKESLAPPPHEPSQDVTLSNMSVRKKWTLWPPLYGLLMVLILVSGGAYAYASGIGRSATATPTREAAPGQVAGQTDGALEPRETMTATLPPAVTPSPTLTSTPQPPAQMSGSINIAVAEFCAVVDQESGCVDQESSSANQAGCHVTTAEAHGLSDVIFRKLADHVQSGRLDLGAARSLTETTGVTMVIDLKDTTLVWPPEQTGTITGATIEGQAKAAEEKAREINADVILYGTAQCSETPRKTTLTPYVYISDRKLQSFEQLEFVGSHAFGSEIITAGIPSNASTRQDISDSLGSRMDMLVKFLIGLDFYYASNNEVAAAVFDAANSVASSDVAFFKALVTLFQGTTAARLNDYVSAQTYYSATLAIDPTNVRAQYSVAEAIQNTSSGDCIPDIGSPSDVPENIDGLREALRRFREIKVEDYRAPSTAMRGLLALHTGQVYLCLKRLAPYDDPAALDYLSFAEDLFRNAMQYFDGDSKWARDHLAEAYLGLGDVFYEIAAPMDEQDIERPTNWRKSAKQYCDAISLTSIIQRQVTLYYRLAWLHGQLREYDQAEIEFAKAVKLDPASESSVQQIRSDWQKAKDEYGRSETAQWNCETTSSPNP